MSTAVDWYPPHGADTDEREAELRPPLARPRSVLPALLVALLTALVAFAWLILAPVTGLAAGGVSLPLF